MANVTCGQMNPSTPPREVPIPNQPTGITTAVSDTNQDSDSSRSHVSVVTTRRATTTVVPPIHSGRSSLLCGLVAGVAQAGFFNPYDRALYLAVKEKRPFLDARNWHNPYNGFLQSLASRAMAGGLYFPTERFFLQCASDSPAHHFWAGTAAGAVNACVLSPFTAIRYTSWGRVQNRGMLREAFSMLRKSSGSLRPFFNGLLPTLYRDVVFGGCYTWLRLQIPYWYHKEWMEESALTRGLCNFMAAALATILSGPFNYVRVVQLSTSAQQRADTTWYILGDLLHQTRQEPRPLYFIVDRLRIGWGTVRVALGMSFGHSLYDWLSKLSLSIMTE